RLQDTCQSVGTCRGVVTLPSQRSRQLADSGGIKNSPVDLHMVVVESLRQGVQATLDQAVIVGGNVDPVQQVVAIAGVGEDWVRPAGLFAEIIAHLAACVQGEGFFGIRGGYAAWADRIGVDQKPLSADDVPVARKLPRVGDVDPIAASA